MSSSADRIRRILGDGFKPPSDRPAEPRLRPAPEPHGEEADSPVNRLSPELRARLDALGVGLAGRMPLQRREERETEAQRADRRPPAEALPLAPELAASIPLEAAEPGTPLRDLVGGQERETPLGRFLFLERHYALAAEHGRIPLADGLAHPVPLRPHERAPGEAAALDALPTLAADRAVFIDTETTGLAGGTGTVAFLVGTGHVDGERFVVRQYCMRDYPEEGALLHALREDVGEAPLVSFNGRCFDWPLLVTRFRMHHMDPAPRAHLDLLPPSRRIWARTLHSHSLAALERYVLALERGEDLPGWRIPSAYFDYLRTGHADLVARAFRHNEIDVVSMLALFAQVGQTLADPVRRVSSPGDQLGTARLLLDLGQPELARDCLRAGIDAGDEAEGVPLKRLLGKLCRRAGEDDEALAHWKSVAVSGPGFDPEAYEQVAKIYEHRLKQFDDALEWTQAALDRAAPGGSVEAALKHRAARLRRRLARDASAS